MRTGVVSETRALILNIDCFFPISCILKKVNWKKRILWQSNKSNARYWTNLYFYITILWGELSILSAYCSKESERWSYKVLKYLNGRCGNLSQLSHTKYLHTVFDLIYTCLKSIFLSNITVVRNGQKLFLIKVSDRIKPAGGRKRRRKKMQLSPHCSKSLPPDIGRPHQIAGISHGIEIG